MGEIFLTDEQYKSIPYKDTTISRSRTYGEIIGLLESHHIVDYRYTKVDGNEVLEFPITVKRRDIEQRFIVKMSVPKLMYSFKHGRGYNATKTMTYLENVSWRVFWWYLKSKLEAIEYGISDQLKEFMPSVTYSITDESGTRDVTLGDEVIDHLEELPRLKSGPEKPMLEDIRDAN